MNNPKDAQVWKRNPPQVSGAMIEKLKAARTLLAQSSHKNHAIAFEKAGVLSKPVIPDLSPISQERPARTHAPTSIFFN